MYYIIMGADYFIQKFLNIYYNDIDYLVVELVLDEQKRNFEFHLLYDEDCHDYSEKEDEYIKDCLTPDMEPIIIYINNRFIKAQSEIKYKTLIENELNESGKKWCEITKIIKVEGRVALYV
jgi:hypothetical protein